MSPIRPIFPISYHPSRPPASAPSAKKFKHALCQTPAQFSPMTPQMPRPTRQPGPATPSKIGRQQRFAGLLAVSLAFWPAHVRAIVMDTDTPESAYRAKGLECLGFPGRPLNLRVRVPSQGPVAVSYCGAALLNCNWAITSGHCVQPWQSTGVFLLSTGTNTYYDTRPRVRVKRVVLHPDYKEYIFDPTRVDLALLELEDPIEGYPDAILATQRPPEDTILTVAGFGRAARPLAPALPNGMNGWLRGWLTPYRDLSDPYRVVNNLWTVWTVGRYLNGSGCPGDSGSPYYLYDPIQNHQLLIGIHSGGGDTNCNQQYDKDFCSDLTQPIVRDWIASVTATTPTISSPTQLSLTTVGSEVELSLTGATGGSRN